jgi:hypothetical protein
MTYRLRTVQMQHGSISRDAILLSCSVNAKHGLRRTNADKRRAIERVLADKEWGAMTDTWIAGKCAVDRGLVAAVRKKITEAQLAGFASDTPIVEQNQGSNFEAEPASEARTYVTKQGKIATMKVSDISEAQKKRHEVKPGEKKTGISCSSCCQYTTTGGNGRAIS